MSPRLRSNFIESKQPSPSRKEWSDDSPERLNICADRIGQSKTSLMDFKKLLLAKSAKNSPVHRKVSAVELLKKPISSPADETHCSLYTITAKKQANVLVNSEEVLDHSLKLLELNSSPRAFANRRMLRQGEFGSPSKSFASKLKINSPNARQRTEIISSIIPEVNGEEDHSFINPPFKMRSSFDKSVHDKQRTLSDLKSDILLQTEEDDFIRTESKSDNTNLPDNKVLSCKSSKDNSMTALETAL